MKLIIADIISLIRVRQWYKNLVLLLPLLFVGHLFVFSETILALEGFFILCLLYAAVYVFNDIIDRHKDAAHPEKCTRPVASKRISVGSGLLIGSVLLLVALIGSYVLSRGFFVVMLVILGVNIVYTFLLKEVLFADILMIATLFVLRAVSGAVLISVTVSPWLILCPFFLSLFLSVGKRHGDVVLMGDKAAKTREVLRGYTPEITSGLMMISTTLLIMSYALYCFLSDHRFLLLSLPFGLFVVFRYYYLITSGSDVARHPERMFRDIPLMVGVFLWGIVTGGVLYFSTLLQIIF